jgi:hypothetical protein
MRRLLFNIAAAFILVASIAGCGGGGGGGGSSNTTVTPPPPPPAVLITNADLQGTWDVSFNGSYYARIVLDGSGNMLSCTDVTFHAGGYALQSNVPYSASVPYTAKFLIDAERSVPFNPDAPTRTVTTYSGYLTTDKLTWIGTYVSTRWTNGSVTGTANGTFSAMKVPTGAG